MRVERVWLKRETSADEEEAILKKGMGGVIDNV